MAKVKEVSSYSGSAWGTAVPIGANATNIDMASNPSDYDSSTTETSTDIIGTNDVKIISSDTDLTAWGKFNRFRKRVSNAFGTLSGKTLATAYTTASPGSKIYSASVLNDYMTNVIGYSGTTAPSEGTVASQLSSLNSNLIPFIYNFTSCTQIKEFTTTPDSFEIPESAWYRVCFRDSGGAIKFGSTSQYALDINIRTDLLIPIKIGTIISWVRNGGGYCSIFKIT